MGKGQGVRKRYEFSALPGTLHRACERIKNSKVKSKKSSAFSVACDKPGLPSFGSEAREIFCRNIKTCTDLSKPPSAAGTLLKHNRSHGFGLRSEIYRRRNKQNEVSLDLWSFASRKNA